MIMIILTIIYDIKNNNDNSINEIPTINKKKNNCIKNSYINKNNNDKNN